MARSLNNRGASSLLGPVLTHSSVTIWRRVSLPIWQLQGPGGAASPWPSLLPPQCCLAGPWEKWREAWDRAGARLDRAEVRMRKISGAHSGGRHPSLKWECSAVIPGCLADSFFPDSSPFYFHKVNSSTLGGHYCLTVRHDHGEAWEAHLFICAFKYSWKI